MTLGFPSVAEVDRITPADRDRAVDVIRIAALVAVVCGHTVMATSMIADEVFHWDNLLTTSSVFQALTWVFQIMPLFFFAGAAACVNSWTPGASWGGWLMKRCQRLFRPVFYYLAFWAVALAALHVVLPINVYRPIAGISTQLLWFLGAYVLMLAAIPLLSRITTVGRLAGSVVAVYATVAVIDAIRLANDAGSPGIVALGYVNMTVWLVPGMFGVAYRRQLLSKSAAFAVAAAVFTVDLGLLFIGPYELSLVGIEGQRIANMSPPSLLLAGHAIAMCAFTIAAMPTINRWAHRPRVWWLTAIGNSGAMTLYLWHMPALLLMHLAFDMAGWYRYPGEPKLLLLSIIQLTLMMVLVAILFMALRPLENNPLPGWDGGALIDRPGLRSAAVGISLCIAGAALLVSVKWGLKDAGLICFGVMLAGLMGARALARQPSDGPAEPHTDARSAASAAPADR